jgi:hypothetical protein
MQEKDSCDLYRDIAGNAISYKSDGMAKPAFLQKI